jgi:hypothetical protein
VDDNLEKKNLPSFTVHMSIHIAESSWSGIFCSTTLLNSSANMLYHSSQPVRLSGNQPI